MKPTSRSIVITRVKAFAIDYLIILGYIIILFGITFLVAKIFAINLAAIDTLTGQLIGFLTLTLPVILYFTFTEAGPHAASVGKQKTGLSVVMTSGSKAGRWRLLARNCIKFLPWEMAHFFVYRLFYYEQYNEPTPQWVLHGLITAQVLALVYLLLIFFNKNNRSIYEILSSTAVIRKSA